ncbi:BglG family transcription antiterminator [Paenibacillus puldeungensis]
MNTRQKDILYTLITEPRPHFVVRDIALKLNCSEKTIRSDFEEIDRYLNESSHARLIRKPGLGVTLEIEESEKAKILDELYWSADRREQDNDDHRIALIAYQLLMSTKPLTIQELAAKYYVNKAVIKKELDTLRQWLEKRGLDIVFRQKVGITIAGRERDRRAALSKLSQLTGHSGTHFIKEQFASHEVEIVTRELRQLEKDAQLIFTDEAFDNLLVHTLLMVRRTKLKQLISFSDQEKTFIRERSEFTWTSAFVRKLEPLFSVRFSEDEVSYLTAHILGGKIRSQSKSETNGEVDHPARNKEQIHNLVESLVKKMSALTWVEFAEDATLMEGLHIHLYSTINRLSYGLAVYNPMLQDIKKMYPYMFDMVIYAIKEISSDYPFTIPEEEAAYLTLHFQAAIERLNKQAERVKHVITVCHMGVGMSQILRSKLERKFQGLHVADSVRKVDLAGYLNRHPVDFIVSTIPLENIAVPYILVSPLLETSEVKKLNDFIERLDDDAHHPEAVESTLHMYARPSLVFPKLEISHRFELIELLANELYEQGFALQDYAHQALLRERISSTAIGGGIAIPHGEPKLIKQSQIAIATLKEPLDWEQEKVSVVFMLALQATEQENMKKLFQRLSLLSEQPSTIERLIRADRPEQLLDIL